MGNEKNTQTLEAGDNEVLVVSQTGGGEFKSIARAIAQAKPGATIRIGSGFYEEALVINKPLTLIGDATGLPVITSSDFAVLTVRSAKVTLENIALVSGLRTPSIEIASATVEFNASILWALDTFLKRTTPSLIPARALVAESFLGDCMRNWISIASVIGDLLQPFDFAREGPPRSAGRELSAPPQNQPPDVLLNSGACFAGANSVIGMASFVGNERSTVSFSNCRLDYTSVTSCGGSEVLLSGCERFGDPWKPRVYIQRGGCRETFSQMNAALDLAKREMEAVVRLQIASTRNDRRLGENPRSFQNQTNNIEH